MKSLIRYFLLVQMRPFLRYAPMWMVRALAMTVATLEYLYHKRARMIIATEFVKDLPLPPARLRNVVFLSFYHHLMGDFEIIRYPFITREFVARHVVVTGPGWEFIQKNPGKPAILCTFHFGPNQIVIPTLPLLGIPFAQMGMPPTEWDRLAPGNRWTRAVNRALTDGLEGTATNFIYVSEGIPALRKIRQVIKDGHVLCVACDGRAGEVEPHPFLHGKTEISPGGIGIAARYEIPLIPLFSRRTSSGYNVTLHEPLYVATNQEQEAIRTCISLLEGYVKAYPEQYGWMYYAKAVGG